MIAVVIICYVDVSNFVNPNKKSPTAYKIRAHIMNLNLFDYCVIIEYLSQNFTKKERCKYSSQRICTKDDAHDIFGYAS